MSASPDDPGFDSGFGTADRRRLALFAPNAAFKSFKGKPSGASRASRKGQAFRSFRSFQSFKSFKSK
jgi:uncharacterized protein with von Willebrand factor type A (vWA) domain